MASARVSTRSQRKTRCSISSRLRGCECEPETFVELSFEGGQKTPRRQGTACKSMKAKDSKSGRKENPLLLNQQTSLIGTSETVDRESKTTLNALTKTQGVKRNLDNPDNHSRKRPLLLQRPSMSKVKKTACNIPAASTKTQGYSQESVSTQNLESAADKENSSTSCMNRTTTEDHTPSKGASIPLDEWDMAEQNDTIAKTLFNGVKTLSLTDTKSNQRSKQQLVQDVGLFNCETDVEYLGKVFGEGTDGKVEACRINGQYVALKKSKPNEVLTKEMAKMKSSVEVHYLRKVRHYPGFTKCLGVCDGIDHTCIALEIIDQKLSDYQRKRVGSKQPLPLNEALSIIHAVCQAMIILHDEVGVAHGDLACRNILVADGDGSQEIEIKLADFGRVRDPSSEPSILDGNVSFYKNVDVGSFGREILYRLLVGDKLPQSSVQTRSLYKKLSDTVVMSIPSVAEERLGKYMNLFYRCVSWGVRPTFKEILEHIDHAEYFGLSENADFVLKPLPHTVIGRLSRRRGEAADSFESPTVTTTSDNHRINRSLLLSAGGAASTHESTPGTGTLRTSQSMTNSSAVVKGNHSLISQTPRGASTTSKATQRVTTPLSNEVRKFGSSRRSLKILKEISRMRDAKQ